MASQDAKADEATAKDAVLVQSVQLSSDIPQVKGIDFNDYESSSGGITVEAMMSGMANLGFQATNLGESIKLINEMVSRYPLVPPVDTCKNDK